MSRAALGVAALAMAGVLVRGPSATVGPELVLVAAAYLALAVMVGAERRRRRLDRRLVLAVSGTLLVAAVAVPPTESGDLWSYAMYGRMVARYQVSPYRHVPAEFRTDPIGRRVPAFWSRSPSVYGPLFTGVSAAGMWAVGHSALGARLFFQGLAALAVALALVLVDRRRRDPMALALLGANPLVVLSVVNGGHNDALVGLALLGGVLAVTARRPVWAGVALAAGALVKVALLLPIAALAAWVWWHQGRRAAAALGAATAATGLAGLAAADAPAVMEALSKASRRVNGGSVWAGPRRWLAAHGSSLARGDALAWAGTAAAVALLVALAARRRNREGPALVAGGAVVAYLLVGPYVLPWYLAWGLPVLALVWRWRVVWVAMAQAAVLQLATARPVAAGPRGPLWVGDPVSRFQFDLYFVGAPLLEVALVVLVVVAMARRLGPVSGAGARLPRRPGRVTGGR